jgi:serine/threonine protein phosphatase PrpC
MAFLRKLFRGNDQPDQPDAESSNAAAKQASPKDRAPDAQQAALQPVTGATSEAQPPSDSSLDAPEPAPDAKPGDITQPWWADSTSGDSTASSETAPTAPAPADSEQRDSDAQPVNLSSSDEMLPEADTPTPATEEFDPALQTDTTATDAAAEPAEKRTTQETAPLEMLEGRVPAPFGWPDPSEGAETGEPRLFSPEDRQDVTTTRSRRGLAVAALRDIGRIREVNQDSIFTMTTTAPRESSDITVGLYIVADGMGGHAGGEVASRLAISTVARHVMADLIVPALEENVTEALHPLIVSAVQEANRVIWDHAQSIGSDMGTTCTAALMLSNSLYIGHVGDTRAYLLTPQGMVCITTDHSSVGRLIQLGQLHPSEAREHPLRSQLYRTVGQQPDVLVDFIYQPLGDATHLLLASDGLWSLIDEAVIQDVLEQTVWPQDACRELVARANHAGGDDNISVIIVSLPEVEQRLHPAARPQ